MLDMLQNLPTDDDVEIVLSEGTRLNAPERYIGRRGGAQGYTSKPGGDIGFRSAGTGLRVLSYITSPAGWV